MKKCEILHILSIFCKKSTFIEYSTGPEYSSGHKKFFLSPTMIDLRNYFLKYMDLTKTFENIDSGAPHCKIHGIFGIFSKKNQIS